MEERLKLHNLYLLQGLALPLQTLYSEIILQLYNSCQPFFSYFFKHLILKTIYSYDLGFDLEFFLQIEVYEQVYYVGFGCPFSHHSFGELLIFLFCESYPYPSFVFNVLCSYFPSFLFSISFR